MRGVESISTGLDPAELAREAGRRLGLIASVTGPVDYVSDGERVLAVGNGHELLATVTGTGCMSTAMTGCFLAGKPEKPLEAAAEALAAFGVAAEDAAAGAGGPGTFHARLYLESRGQEQSIDIRPSDAVALAVRTETPIFVAEAVFDQAGIVPREPTEAAEGETPAEPPVEIDESKLTTFKEFIETLDIDDLGPGGEPKKS